MSDSAINAARATGLIAHSSQCSLSGLASCVCGYKVRLETLAAAFEKFAEEDRTRLIVGDVESDGMEIPGHRLLPQPILLRYKPIFVEDD